MSNSTLTATWNETVDTGKKTSELAATFDSRKNFWDFLKRLDITWEESNDANINDLRAKISLAEAFAKGFDPEVTAADKAKNFAARFYKREIFFDVLKRKGITWDESPNEDINFARATDAIKSAILDGRGYDDSGDFIPQLSLDYHYDGSLMYGAIIGDIVGSRFEGDKNSIKTKNFRLFDRGSHFTDDTVLTIAIADALLTCDGIDERSIKSAVTKAMQRFGRDYPHAGYGRGFKGWLYADAPHPYKSFGNGAAMRVSAVAMFGELFEDLDLVREVARWTAEVTHNHPDGIKGAEAVASAIFLAAQSKSKDEIKSYIEENFGYDLSRTLDDIRPTYRHETAAEKSVPEAIIAFLEATDFEDAIRNAVSLGGDADTLAAIAGSIAEAFYDVPDDFKEIVRQKLPNEMFAVLDKVNRLTENQLDISNGFNTRSTGDLDEAIRKFNCTNSSDDKTEVIDQFILSTGHRCYIMLPKINRDSSYDFDSAHHDKSHFQNLDSLFMRDERGKYFLAAFTNFYQFARFENHFGDVQCEVEHVKVLLQDFAKHGRENCAGIVFNPCGGEQFILPADDIDEVLYESRARR